MPLLESLLYPIHLPNRNPILPKLYYSFVHPQVPTGDICIITEQDLSHRAMEALLKWEREQVIPRASDEELMDRSLFCMPHDREMLVFSGAKGATSALDNALQAWSTPASLIPQDVKDNLRAAMDTAMGLPELITLAPCYI
ncbi:hypothetical protein C8R46DRAFT_1029148 [Mycena filopes]|nr:hypothetical protein C8R46DRAFT_1029148 [Mycena filopes]